jgi:Kef-type K+ transport system membrane component KefB
MWLLILLVVLIGALTGTLGQILEVAAGVVVGLILFVVGVILAAYYYVRHRFRRAARDWERAREQGTGGYPRGPYGELPPGPRDPDSV